MYQVEYFLARNALSFPDAIAVADQKDTLTWSELNQQSTILANAMISAGISKGERIAVIWENSIAWVIIFYACQKLGVAVVPLSSRLLPKELARIITIAKCKVLFASSRHTNIAHEIVAVHSPHELTALVTEKETDIPGHTTWEHFCSFGSEKNVEVEVNEDDESVVLFTSGTTGCSKGVVRTQRMVRDHALVLAVENRVLSNEKEVMLTSSPFDHTAGLLCIIKMAALAGTLVLIDELKPRLILQLIDRFQVTQILMVPPIIYGRLLSVAEWRDYNRSSVQEVLVSAGRCQSDYAKTISRLFPQAALRTSWGSTETCSVTGMVVTYHQLKESPDLVRSIGTLNCLVEVRLVDQEGNDVEVGQVGEAWVRSPMVCTGYIGAAEESKNCFTEDAWFKTGDLLTRDEEGRYYFIDRVKDVIKTGGENVYAQEVEKVILEHPSVFDCAVVGIPDECFEEGIAVAVVLNEGATLSGEELKAFCLNRMPSYKKPRYFAIVKELPINERGKVLKRKLREQGREIFAPLY